MADLCQLVRVRRELRVPTAFNFLGPLTNPARPHAQIVGVSDPRMLPLVAEVACATQIFAPCPSNPRATYPRPTKVYLKPIPIEPTMPNPCLNVPSNPWCP